MRRVGGEEGSEDILSGEEGGSRGRGRGGVDRARQERWPKKGVERRRVEVEENVVEKSRGEEKMDGFLEQVGRSRLVGGVVAERGRWRRMRRVAGEVEEGSQV